MSKDETKDKKKQYRMAYDALFNYWGESLFFHEKKVAGTDVFFQFSVFKGESELYFGKEEEPLDISALKIQWNGTIKKKIWLIDLIDCSVDKEQGFCVRETEIAKRLRKGGYSFLYKPIEFLIDVFENENEVCSYPITVDKTTFINFITNNYEGFDNTDNYHAQSTAYFSIEVND